MIDDILNSRSEIVKNLEKAFHENIRQLRQIPQQDKESVLILLESGYGWVLRRCISNLEDTENNFAENPLSPETTRKESE